MILSMLKSGLQMIPDLVLSLNSVKWLLIWLEVKVNVKKKHNCPKILLLPYIILAMGLLVYVDTLKLQVINIHYLGNFQLIH